LAGKKFIRNTAQTLISKSHSELARNKPIVKGFVAGLKSNIFIDSGAEINVIDETYLHDLMKNSKNAIKIQPSSSRLNCANGSKMIVKGTTKLSLMIGNTNKIETFTIVNKIFPKVFVGLKSMKSFEMVMHANNSCLTIGNVTIPFISKVESLKSIPNQKNGQQSNHWSMMRL
jgi:hypothetical protein